MTLAPVSGSVLTDIIDWVRRIIKSNTSTSISNETICSYINRFYVYDSPARLQLFDLKSQYVFETIPNTFQYQFPYLNYQMVLAPVYVDGMEISYYQSNSQFYRIYPEQVMNEQPIQGDGSPGPYAITFSQNPVLKGFKNDNNYQSNVVVPPVSPLPTVPVGYPQTLQPRVFITAYDVTGVYMYVVDDGEGNLIQTDDTFQNGPNGIGQAPVSAGTVDYLNGTCSVTFNSSVVAGENINVQSTPYSSGRPKALLFYNGYIKVYPVPDRSYKVQMDCYITPAQFLTLNDAVNFSYMSEWIARGAARKILSDVGDVEQMNFYEPLFREQENQVLRRSDRQNSTQRTPTIFSAQTNSNPFTYTQY